MSETILLVDDELAIRQMLRFALTSAGYSCLEAGDAEEAKTVIARETPDMILLDWMLPGVSGVDLTRRLKRDIKTKDIPIIMLTAKGEEHDKIKGLETGADDYVTKPFSTNELIARVKAVLRRSTSSSVEGLLEIEGLKLDTQTHRVSTNGTCLELSPTEFRLLEYFISHRERVYTRAQLLDQIWGDNVYIEERTVDVHIRRLRKILAPHGYDRFIQTVRSVGYRFSTQ